MPEQITMKSLYLEGARGTTVLRDGPALRVRCPNRADALFPLERLSRVVARSDVQWHTAALLACAESNVPVTFVSAYGDPRARLLSAGPDPDRLGLGEALRAVLEAEGGRDRYRDWTRAAMRRAVLPFVPWSARGGDLPTPKTVRRLMNQRLAGYVRAAELRRFDRQVHGLLTDRIHTSLTRAGWPLSPVDAWRYRICLPRDFADVVTLRLLVPRDRFLRHLGARAHRKGRACHLLEWRDAVAFVERHARDVDRWTHRLARNLHALCLQIRYGHGPE